MYDVLFPQPEQAPRHHQNRVPLLARLTPQIISPLINKPSFLEVHYCCRLRVSCVQRLAFGRDEASTYARLRTAWRRIRGRWGRTSEIAGIHLNTGFVCRCRPKTPLVWASLAKHQGLWRQGEVVWSPSANPSRSGGALKTIFGTPNYELVASELLKSQAMAAIA